MSIINTFSSFPEVKLLLLEVSNSKRKALLEKISEILVLELGKRETHERVVDLINTQPRLVEEISKKAQGGKHELSDSIRQQEDNVYERYHEFTFEIPEKYENSIKQTHGVDALVACIVMFYHLEQVDPTGNMKYGNWLIDVVLKWAVEAHQLGNLGEYPLQTAFNFIRADRRFFEDLPKLRAYLEAYDEAKRRNELPDKYKDINQIKPAQTEGGQYAQDPFDILRAITAEFRSIETGDFFQAVKSNLVEGEDYEILEELSNFVVYKPLSQKGASILGMNTEWCTTYGEHCTNPDYQDRRSAFSSYGDLIIMVNKQNPDIKYQMEEDGDQFMDEDDNYVKLGHFQENHPELYDYLLNKDLLDTPLWLKKGDGGWIIESKPIADFIADWFKDNDNMSHQFVKDLFSGEGWQYFIDTQVPALTDIYLPSETDKNKELVDMVKKEMYKMIKEYPDYFKESEYSLQDIKEKETLDGLFDIITDVDIFDALGDAIHSALRGAQANADEGEAYEQLLNAFKKHWLVREIDWGNNKIIIEDDMVPDIVEWYNADGIYNNADERVMVEFYPPRYGFQGDIHPDTLHDYFTNEFAEL